MAIQSEPRPSRRHGFVGLGSMGEPMATCMVRAGLDVSVADLRNEPVARLAGLGARRAGSSAEVAASCDVLHLMVVDDSQADEVLLGADGALAAMTPGSVVVVHSTVSPAACRRIATAAADREVDFLDAPVAGGVWAAAAGELTIMIGGDAAALATARPALEAMASKLFHVGGVGSGQVAKIVNNMVVIVNRHTLHSALRLAAACELDESAVLEVLRAGSAASWAADHYESFFELAARAADRGEHVARLARKDLELASALAAEVGRQLPSVSLAAAAVEDLYVAEGGPGGPGAV